MITKLIDGRSLSATLIEALKIEVESFKVKPNLAIVLVGDNASSILYIKNKMLKADFIGIKSQLIHLKNSTTQEELTNTIETLNSDETVHAIIVQMPLPSHLNANKAILTIYPSKDVDGLHPLNVGYSYTGTGKFIPGTALACLYAIKSIKPDISGMNVLVINRSNIVGRPLVPLLLNENATVTIAHSLTKNLPNISKQADIVITAVGKPKIFSRKYFSHNAIIIDVGMSYNNKSFIGDVDFDDLIGHASYITPVPGGVGPLTVAFILSNVVKAANRF